ncbi:MAG: SDR family NAD(P)-dependent oxidoreductase [Lachnospiraceae bacterium]|nr:SDR family NAD(P)-dependent oxidoreductase [Lachnospiraceae bacterium]
MNLAEAKEYAKKNIHVRPATTGRLAGKIAIVTGGAQGFGLGIATEMYREGASVVLADLNEAQAIESAKGLGERAVGLKVDVSDAQSMEDMVCSAVERFGGLDIFVSNAGVLKAGSLETITPEAFTFVTKVNYIGFFNAARAASAIMKAQHEADPELWFDIVQINSKSGLEGSKNNSAYAGGKFGGIGLTQSFALELVDSKIKVNAICPGNFYDGPLWSDPEKGLFVQYLNNGKVPGAKTVQDVKDYYLSKSPIRRGCTPVDVSKALFYCVEQEYETGQAIPVTGGQTMLN